MSIFRLIFLPTFKTYQIIIYSPWPQMTFTLAERQDYIHNSNTRLYNYTKYLVWWLHRIYPGRLLILLTAILAQITKTFLPYPVIVAPCLSDLTILSEIKQSIKCMFFGLCKFTPKWLRPIRKNFGGILHRNHTANDWQLLQMVLLNQTCNSSTIALV
jgi:hypothetical protein